MLALLAASLALLAFAPLASAAPKGVIDDFGSNGTGNGQFGSNSPVGIAINQSGAGGASAGDVYVVDPANNRIQRFDTDGEFLGSFGSAGAGNGQFSNPRGIAIDQTSGAVYVTDQTNRRVQKFGAAGAFERMWGWGVLDGSAAFQVCTSAQTCQAGTTGNEGGRFSTTIGFPAVHPESGDVYVGDGTNRRVQVFDSSGNFQRLFGWDVVVTDQSGDVGTNNFEICTSTAVGVCKGGSTTTGTDNGRFGANQPIHLAIDTSGATDVLFASDSNLSNRVQRINITAPATPAPMSAIGVPPLLNAVTSGLAVDPATNNLFVVRDPSSGETVVQEVTDPSGSPVLGSDNHAAGEGWSTTASGPVGGVAIRASSGNLYVTRTGTGFNQVAILGAGTAPTGTLNPTSAITPTTATLNASVDANGSKTYYQFQYRLCSGGTCPGSGAFTNAPTTLTSAGKGNDSVDVSAALSGLLPGETYEVQLLVDGFGAPLPLIGTDATGDFTTVAIPPMITNRPAAPVTDTTALLQAAINPNNATTSYYFQYLTDAAFKANGNSYSGPNAPVQVPVVAATLPAGMEPIVVFEQLSGLTPESTYHFRVVANNGTGGDQFGPDQTFTTKPVPGPPSPTLDRAYELVSPSDKLGGIGIGEYYSSLSAMAQAGVPAHEGERFASQGSFGSVLLGDAAFSFANDWALGERKGSTLGWRHHPVLTHPSGRPQFASFLTMRASSADLSKFVWDANSTPAFFPEYLADADPLNDRPGWGNISAPWFSDFGPPARWEAAGPTSLEQLRPLSVITGLSNNVVVRDRMSSDGSAALIQVRRNHQGSLPLVHGLAGPGDPTWPAFGDMVDGRSVYLVDLSEPFSDSGQTRDRELINVCTGSAGAGRTRLPALAEGKVSEIECPAAEPGRDARLVSNRGATASRVNNEGAASTPAFGSISADGSHVFFLSPDPAAGGTPNGTTQFCSGSGATSLCPPQLFVSRLMPDGTRAVRWISKAEPGLFGAQDASLIGATRFEGATPDGDKVFFRTNAPLTMDDRNGGGIPPAGGVTTGTSSPTSWDLYMYDLPDDPGADPGTGTLTRISAGPDGDDPDSRGDGDCNSPLPSGSSDDGRVDALRFASDDGQRVYFTCAAPLPGVVAQNGTITAPGGTQTTPDQTNLYLYDANLPATDRWRFVARVPRAIGAARGAIDACVSTSPGSPVPLITSRSQSPERMIDSRPNCVSGTKDGGFVVFPTQSRLLADDPPGSAVDIYAYDAVADELILLSSPQGGVGGSYQCVPPSSSVPVPPLCHADLGIVTSTSISWEAANAPLGLATDPATPGQLIAFFQSRARLVPEDTDDDYDVYQWRDGRLSLLTTGQSLTDGALYAGSDESGQNVYFVTRDALTWQDKDAVADVYTARIDGGIEQPLEPPLCAVLADGCQGAATSPPAATSAGSSVFSGDGNVVDKRTPRRCANGKVRKGKRCVAKRALARRACAKRKGKAKRRCVRKQVRRLNQAQKRQQRQARTTNTTGRAHR